MKILVLPRLIFLWNTRITLLVSGEVETISFKNLATGRYTPRNWFDKDLETVNF